MNFRPLGLLLPAVLASCVSHSPNKDAPAYVYVDSLIADSAQTISLAQTSLNQTGPNPIRPSSPPLMSKRVPLVSSRPSAASPQLPSAVHHLKSEAQALPLSNVVYNGRPGSLQFPQRAGNVHGITVETAVKRIAPSGWSVSWSPGTEKTRRQRLNLSLNDQWPRVLNNLMYAKSLYATVEWDQSQIRVTPYSPGQRLFSSH